MGTSRRPSRYCWALVIGAIAALGGGLAPSAAAQDAAVDVSNTATPIKHLVVVIAENRGCDHIYATYIP